MHWIALAPTSTDAQGQLGLGWWALQWTPRVALAEDSVVLLEVSGCERLWGGRAALLHKISKQKQQMAGELSAQAATSLIAIALLRCKQHGASALTDVPDGLPLHTLSAARAHLPTLERLGLRTWGALRALPRGGVARRFGAPLLEALDAAYGERPERHGWLTLPEVFELKMELPALAEAAPELMFAVQRLLHALHAWLQRSAQGVLALQLQWQLDTRRVDGERVPPHQQLSIRTAQATQDIGHLARLISENLNRCTLPAPAHSLSLRTLEAIPLVHHNESLLLQEKRKGDSLQQLVERLGARLGAEQVLHAVSVADHRPECMTQWKVAQDATKLIAAYAGNTQVKDLKGLKNAALEPYQPHALTWPTWLLRTPRRLALRSNRPHYQGPLRLLAGPQRLEGGWWAAANPAALAVRDYFVAHSAQAGLLWIYRERLPQLEAEEEQGEIRWFLHGVYA